MRLIEGTLIVMMLAGATLAGRCQIERRPSETDVRLCLPQRLSERLPPCRRSGRLLLPMFRTLPLTS